MARKTNPNLQRGGRTPPARGGRKWCQDCDREIEKRLSRWVTVQDASVRCSQSSDKKHHPA